MRFVNKDLSGSSSIDRRFSRCNRHHISLPQRATALISVSLDLWAGQTYPCEMAGQTFANPEQLAKHLATVQLEAPVMVDRVREAEAREAALQSAKQLAASNYMQLAAELAAAKARETELSDELASLKTQESQSKCVNCAQNDELTNELLEKIQTLEKHCLTLEAEAEEQLAEVEEGHEARTEELIVQLEQSALNFRHLQVCTTLLMYA